ncbi:MAG: hypothetical protein KA712_24455 [Myxococcales bacterium]|nr:hypothetical protein [Myxococcales bacterium]
MLHARRFTFIIALLPTLVAACGPVDLQDLLEGGGGYGGAAGAGGGDPWGEGGAGGGDPWGEGGAGGADPWGEGGAGGADPGGEGGAAGGDPRGEGGAGGGDPWGEGGAGGCGPTQLPPPPVGVNPNVRCPQEGRACRSSYLWCRLDGQQALFMCGAEGWRLEAIDGAIECGEPEPPPARR